MTAPSTAKATGPPARLKVATRRQTKPGRVLLEVTVDVEDDVHGSGRLVVLDRNDSAVHSHEDVVRPVDSSRENDRAGRRWMSGAREERENSGRRLTGDRDVQGNSARLSRDAAHTRESEGASRLRHETRTAERPVRVARIDGAAGWDRVKSHRAHVARRSSRNHPEAERVLSVHPPGRRRNPRRFRSPDKDLSIGGRGKRRRG